jgi:hypothetical protein
MFFHLADYWINRAAWCPQDPLYCVRTTQNLMCLCISSPASLNALVREILYVYVQAGYY